jgi:hypothetical protein
VSVSSKQRDLIYTIPRSIHDAWRYTSTGLDLKTRYPGSPSVSGPYLIQLKGVQQTVSENHPDWRSRSRGNFESDVGGNFMSLRQYVVTPNPVDRHFRTGTFFSDQLGGWCQISYTGPVYMPISYGVGTIWPPFADSSPSQLDALGTTAIARCSPTNPVASFSVAVLDSYHDGLPAMVGHRTWEDRSNLARSAGDEYLNVEFGWLPLVSDITSFANGVINLDKLQSQFVRDSGNVVRRRYSFPPSVVTSDSVVRTNAQVSGPESWGLWANFLTRGTVTRSRETSVSTWFSGAFTYHAPSTLLGDSWPGHVLNASQLLGADLNPETLWQLAPWSWAVDWFSNVGDVIHNVNAYSNYGQVMKYGYIMQHSYVRDTYTYSGGNGLNVAAKYSGYPDPLIIISEKKIRRRATPYGFGIDLSVLNNTQKAIIAALGLSRLS